MQNSQHPKFHHGRVQSFPKVSIHQAESASKCTGGLSWQLENVRKACISSFGKRLGCCFQAAWSTLCPSTLYSTNGSVRNSGFSQIKLGAYDSFRGFIPQHSVAKVPNKCVLLSRGKSALLPITKDGVQPLLGSLSLWTALALVCLTALRTLPCALLFLEVHCVPEDFWAPSWDT